MGDIEKGVSIEPASDTSTAPSSNDESNHRSMSFVDYVVPPRPVPPPAKYKLWFLIIFLVYFAEWFSAEAGFLPWLQDTFRLSLNGALFIMLGCTVACLVYAALDLLVFCCRIKIRGEWYGLGRWLKQPRIQWVHEYENCLVECLAKICHIFEEGFALFNVPQAEKQRPRQFECDGECTVVLKIENHVRPDKAKEYKAWTQKLAAQGCLDRPGLMSVEKEMIADAEKGDLHIVYLTFSSVDLLNEYMTSPVRARLVRKLQPLLVTPSVVQLQKDRVLPDAFTDLCTQQGQAVPVRLPKKWKVWFITTLALWFVVLITNVTLGAHYYEVWGLTNVHVRLQAFVRVLFSTYLNAYVMTPFLMMIFGNWMKRQEYENDKREPWRTLNDGFDSIWGKIVLVFAFYGTCGIVWAVRSAS